MVSINVLSKPCHLITVFCVAVLIFHFQIKYLRSAPVDSCLCCDHPYLSRQDVHASRVMSAIVSRALDLVVQTCDHLYKILLNIIFYQLYYSEAIFYAYRTWNVNFRYANDIIHFCWCYALFWKHLVPSKMLCDTIFVSGER